MFTWLREYRERARIQRLFARYVSPETVAEMASPAPASFEPHSEEAELILVLVEADTEAKLNELIGAVAADSSQSDATVLSFLGSMILIAFGMPRPQPNGSELRATLVKRLAARHGASIRILHGRWPSLVGNIGGSGRWTYTAVPAKFADILAKLSKLHPGEVSEHVA